MTLGVGDRAVAALADGTAAMSCGCMQLSKEQQRALREEVADRQRRRELRNWKPGGRDGS